jgi:hypothetical protein
MKPDMSHPVQQTGRETDRFETRRCNEASCQTGVCSPCLIIWGVVAAMFLITALLKSVL